MDPLSITVSCLTLIDVASKTSRALTTFIRGCRAARSDLASISGELTQLQLVLELLKDDTNVTDDRIIPRSLQTQILSIIANCSDVVDKISKVLEKHAGKAGPAKWTAFGKTEVNGLRMSLEAHRGSLSLVLDLVSVSLSKAIKEDMAAARTDVRDIKQDTCHIPNIMDELAEMRRIVAAGGRNYILEQYLDSLTSYAETVINQDVGWDSDRSIHVPSVKISPASSPKPTPSRRSAPNNVNSAVNHRDADRRPRRSQRREKGITTHRDAEAYSAPDLEDVRFPEVEGFLRKPAAGNASGTAVTLPPPATGPQTRKKRTVVLIADEKNVDKVSLMVAFANGCGQELHLSDDLCTGGIHLPEICVKRVGGHSEFELDVRVWGNLQRNAIPGTYYSLYGGLRGLRDLYDVDEIKRELPDARVLLLAFSIDAPDSFHSLSLKSQLFDKARSGRPGTGIIVVGLRKDLRHDPKTIADLAPSGQYPVSRAAGQALASRMGASEYCEASTKTGEGVPELFAAIVKLVERLNTEEEELVARNAEELLAPTRKKGRFLRCFLGEFYVPW